MTSVDLGRRHLWRLGGISWLCIVTLALGIGINAALFETVDALMFRPPAQVRQPNEVYRVQFRVPNSPEPIERTHYPLFLSLQTTAALKNVAVYVPTTVSIGTGPAAARVSAQLVSANFFDVLGVRPVRGALAHGPDAEGGADRAIISERYWRNDLGASQDPEQLLTIDGRPYSVGAIVPAAFRALSSVPVDVWLPIEHSAASGLAPRQWRDNAGPFWLSVVVRLPAGTDPRVAEDQGTAALATAPWRSADTSLRVVLGSLVPGRWPSRSLEGRIASWLGALSLVVLAMACANVAILVLARAFARQREFFIRVALGEPRRHMIAGNVAEAAVLVLASLVAAFVVEVLVRRAMAAFLPMDVPLSVDWLDARSTVVLLASTAIAFAAVAVSFAVPAALATSSRGYLHQRITPFSMGMATRRLLLVTQTSLALILTAAALLFSASARRVETLDLGVDIKRTVQVALDIPPGQRQPEVRRRLYEAASRVLRESPNVERVALAESSPFLSGAGASPWTEERGQSQLWAHREEVAYRSAVGPGYFGTVGAELLRGRDFTVADTNGAEAVAIVNAPLAAYLWPAGEAIGKCVWLDDPQTCLRVVGVVGGVWKFSALRRNAMAIYIPIDQADGSAPGVLYARLKNTSAGYLQGIRAVVQAAAPGLRAAKIAVVADLVAPEFRPWQMGAAIFGLFGIFALLTAAVGIFSIVTVMAVFRRRDNAIRVALGARWRDVAGSLVAHEVGSVAIGGGLGAIAVVGASKWIDAVLYETSIADPVVVLELLGLLVVMAGVAIVLPLVRAKTIDLVGEMREE